MFGGVYQAPEHEAHVGLLGSSEARRLAPHKDSVIEEEGKPLKPQVARASWCIHI